jgi:type IX secretion system PorP/SprF family membrane protein
MKALIKYFSLLVIILKGGVMFSQQASLFNTYSLDPLQLNIAYAGAACNEANAHYRTQWINMKDAPKSLQLNVQSSLGKSNALALRVNSQTQGLLNTLGATVGYSYRFRVSQNAKMHLGIGIGWTQAALNAQKAIVVDANDVNLNNNNRQTANGFDSEFGAMIVGNKLKAGVSVLHLYNTNPDFSGSGSYKTLPQINSQLSYVFHKNQKIEIEPWLLNRYTLNGNNVVEGMLNFNFIKTLTVGAGYRSNYGLMALLGAKIGGLKIAYSFDYGTGKNSVNLGTSHQVMLGYSFCKNQKTTTNKNGSRKIADTDNSNTEETDAKEEVVKIENPKLEEFKNPAKIDKEEVAKVEDVKGDLLDQKTTITDTIQKNKKDNFTYTNLKGEKGNVSDVDETNADLKNKKAASKVKLGESVVVNNKKEESTNPINSKLDETKKTDVIEKTEEGVAKVEDVKNDLLDEKTAITDSTQKNKKDNFAYTNLKGEKGNVSDVDETETDLKNKKAASKVKQGEPVVIDKKEELAKTENIKLIDSKKTAVVKKSTTASKTKGPESKVEIEKIEEQKAEENLVKADILAKINSLSEEVIFELNNSKLNLELLKKLDEIADLIKTDPSIKLNIIGHTCSKGTKEFNDLLSVRRANYVRQQLMKRGVKSTNFKRSIGDGSSNPLFDNASDNQRKNRSIRFELSK